MEEEKKAGGEKGWGAEERERERGGGTGWGMVLNDA